MKGFIRSFIPSVICQFIHTFIRSFVQPLFHSTRAFNDSFIHSFIHSLIHSLIHPSIHLLIQLIIHSLFDSFICYFISSFVLSLICSFVHLFIHRFFQSFVMSASQFFIQEFNHSFLHSLIPSSHVQGLMHSFVCLLSQSVSQPVSRSVIPYHSSTISKTIGSFPGAPRSFNFSLLLHFNGKHIGDWFLTVIVSCRNFPPGTAWHFSGLHVFKFAGATLLLSKGVWARRQMLREVRLPAGWAALSFKDIAGRMVRVPAASRAMPWHCLWMLCSAAGFIWWQYIRCQS